MGRGVLLFHRLASREPMPSRLRLLAGPYTR